MVAIYQRLSKGPFTFVCGWGPEKYAPETRAWAESGNLYLMHVCDSFWGDPVSGKEPTQVGTLIHESSQYSDNYHSGTADYLYGPLSVHQLAVTNRANAVRNADNYEFYILDAPRV